MTNLSSVNPTRVNGEVLQQSERLKHGDVITIIDRSFRCAMQMFVLSVVVMINRVDACFKHIQVILAV